MKNILSFVFVFCAVAMNAQVTQVSGNQSGTWSGEIHIVGDVMVPVGETLTVEPGTTVIADGYFQILSLGSFYAIGEESARIIFTVADTTGYSNYNDIEAGAWKGITFSKAPTVNLSYCDFSYGMVEDIMKHEETFVAFIFAKDIFYDTYADDCGSWEQQCEWEDTIDKFIKESKNDVIELRDRC